MSYQRSRALCLRKIDYSETSQVLRFFTPEHGKISCIAKGAKRKRGPFLAPFDILGEYDLIRIEKRPETLDIVTQAERRRAFSKLTADYARFSAACYAAEFVDEFTREGLRVEGLYERVLELLDRLEAGAPVPDAIFSFETRALGALGFLPRVRECGACRRAIRGPEAFFSTRDGGAACAGCATRDGRWFAVRRASLESIARFGEGDLPKEPMKAGLVAEIRQILDSCVAYHLDRELKSARFVRAAVMRG